MRRSLLAATIFLAVGGLLPEAARAQQSFATPSDAAAALVDAAKHLGEGRVDIIFGPGGRDLLLSDDPDVDRQRVDDFLAFAGNGSGVVDGADGRKILTFGTQGWQFPIPLRPQGDQWVFDLVAGKQEIRNRTVGRNEIAAIAACSDFVNGEWEYFAVLHDDQPVKQFAREFVSEPGQHNGLWWEPADREDHSPLGDRILSGEARDGSENGISGVYGGYRFKILERQGASAPGGAYSYIVGGRMLAGFALLAYPETWGETGVMTFLCGQDGQAYQRNFGPSTGAVAAAIDSFNPDKNWSAVQD